MPPSEGVSDEDLKRVLARLRDEAREGEKQARAEEKQAEDRLKQAEKASGRQHTIWARKWVTASVIMVFALLIVAALFAAIVPFFMSPPACGDQMLERVLKVAQAIGLPIVTLVLGFYYGERAGR